MVQNSSLNGLPSGSSQWVKNPPANAGDAKEVSSIPGWVRSPEGGGHGNPFQYSCLENSMDRRAWWATVHRVAKLDTAKVTEHAGMHDMNTLEQKDCSG